VKKYFIILLIVFGFPLFSSGANITIEVDTLGNAFFAGEILANFVKTNALTVTGVTTLSGGLIVNQIGQASSTLDILSDATFFGRPYFTADTGGTAIVKKGSRKVAVTFDTEYLAQPIVSATISLDSSTTTDTRVVEEMIFSKGIQYIVTERSTKGFTILLNKAVDEDVTMSWIALAIRDAKISLSTEFDSNTAGTTTPPVVTPDPIGTGTTTTPSDTSGLGQSGTSTSTSTPPVVILPPETPTPVAPLATTTASLDSGIVSPPPDTSVVTVSLPETASVTP